MNDAAARRPPILTGACLYLGALSAIMSIRAIALVSSWNADNRAADFAGSLKDLRDAGLSASGAETFYKTMLTVVAVLAACGAVFAVYTSRGHRASRVGMTVVIGVVGVLTFLGVLGGAFLFAMIGALSVVFSIRLWTGEIRTYFRTLAGHAAPPPKASATPTTDPFAERSVHTPTAPLHHPSEGSPTLPAHGPPGYHQPVVQRREPMPRSVSIAVWSAFAGSIVAAGLAGLALLVLLLTGVDYDVIVERGGPGADMIGSRDEFDLAIRVATTLSSIAVVLGIAGLLASIRVLVTRRSGGVALFVVTVVSFVVSLIGFPLGLPWTAVTIVAWVQLRKHEARAWFSPT